MTKAETGTSPLLEHGVAGAALEGDESGDLEVVVPFPGGVLCAVIDGLGHGPEAAIAARVAAAVIAEHAGEPVLDLLGRCHVDLRRTRGACISLAAFSAGASLMTWVGVGNVDAAMLPADPDRPRGDLLPRAGVVGYHLPALRDATLPVAPGDTLVMATDGLKSSFASRLLPAGPPAAVAQRLLREYGKGTDDALVLVARYLGGGR